MVSTCQTCVSMRYPSTCWPALCTLTAAKDVKENLLEVFLEGKSSEIRRSSLHEEEKLCLGRGELEQPSFAAWLREGPRGLSSPALKHRGKAGGFHLSSV